MREQGIRMKFNPLAEVAGKRLVVVDDSIVRGSTTRQIVQMLFDAGAAEVHVRISSPPVVSPCFYGIDLASEDEMIAAHSTVEEVRAAIGATSLAYISLEGLQAATRRPGERALPRLPDARVPDARPGRRGEAPLRAGLELTARARGTPSRSRGEIRYGRGRPLHELDPLRGVDAGRRCARDDRDHGSTRVTTASTHSGVAGDRQARARRASSGRRA